MTPPPNNTGLWRRFAPLLLCGGLLVVAAAGLANIPEIGTRFWPECFYSRAIRETETNLLTMQAEVFRFKATVDFLDHLLQTPEQGRVYAPDSPEALNKARREFSAELQRSREKERFLLDRLEGQRRLRDKALKTSDRTRDDASGRMEASGHGRN